MTDLRRPGWLIVTALLLLSLNLRPTASAPGPVLTAIRADLGLSGAAAGLLTSLPTVAFCVFGACAPWLANRFGTHRSVIGALVVMVAGQVVRLAATTPTGFLTATIVALAGMAVANVLLPSLVKRHFPDRIGLITALYSTGITAGVTIASMLTAPLAELWGGWRHAFWAWVALAVAALVPWLTMWAYDRGHRPTLAAERIPVLAVGRTRIGWLLGLFFAFQSGQAYAVFGWLATIYTEAGSTPAAAGIWLGIATGVGIPLGFLIPAYTARVGSPYALLGIIFVAGVAGYSGLIVAPTTLPWLWAILVAVGTSAFPIFLAFMGMRARTAAGTASLSAFSQCLGYLVATPWPLLVGVLRDATGSFTAPLLMLIGMEVPLLVFGLLASRPQYLEDQLAAR